MGWLICSNLLRFIFSFLGILSEKSPGSCRGDERLLKLRGFFKANNYLYECFLKISWR